MAIEKDYICISCPIGCRLKLTAPDKKAAKEDLAVSGNKCKRGKAYAIEEFSEPKRVVTATCRIGLENLERLPVKTSSAIPKEYIKPLLEEIYKLKLSRPVKRGDVVIKNFKKTGVDVIASRSV